MVGDNLTARLANLSPAKRALLELRLKEMNGLKGATIYQIIQTWAEKTPEATAIVLPGQEPITYRQLLDQIESIITSLSEIGVGPDDRIAIVLPNGIKMIAAFLGVSCVAISAPLNPSYTENEFDFYLHDLAAKAVVAPSSLDSAAVFAARKRGIPVIEMFSAGTQDSCGFTLKGPTPALAGPHRLSQDDDVALVLHTSGTTAIPKRVPLTHKNLCSSAFFVRDALNLKSSDRCLNLMPLFHIHGLIGGLLSSLAAGASFAAPSKFDGDCFFDWLDELKPTWYTAVPAIHQAILRRAQDRAEKIGESQLRFIRSSSAPLSTKVMTALEELFKVPVIEAYGMTEASHQITSNPLPPFERKKGSVGVATTTDVAIMNKEGKFLAAGKIGEIVIRGANVTSGYESQEANHGAFTNGWFRTGDLGYFDADGYLFLTGRLKEIINRGGETIATREIDDALLEHPDILQAAAFAIPHPTLGETVAAAVVLRDNSRVTEAEIRQHLVDRLADFKIPARLLFVDDLPKTSTGKIRRADLGERVVNEPSTDFSAPKNELELIVAGIYADVLGIQQISARDNFFALGGDSLRATQVISRVRSLFSVNLSIGTLFAKPTVAELAEEIIASAEALDEASKAAILVELKEPSQTDRD